MSWLTNRRVWVVLVVMLAMMAAAYAYVHAPLPDNDELNQVTLDPANPNRTEFGDLTYLGGIDIPRMGQNIGGLSGLLWDEESSRLISITDDARWVSLELDEQDDRLVGLSEVESGPLLGVDGKRLEGKAEGDSESLIRDENGTWGVAFERDHRILAYSPDLTSTPKRTLFDPEKEFGSLDENGGIEAFAVGFREQVICVERSATTAAPNCLYFNYDEDNFSAFPVEPSGELAERGGVPTGADARSDGSFVILFRSYSPTRGNAASIVSYSSAGVRREHASLVPPLTTDNFEGIAVREEEQRTFLYIVSDDNFSGRQRTLLMKFELRSD